MQSIPAVKIILVNKLHSCAKPACTPGLPWDEAKLLLVLEHLACCNGYGFCCRKVILLLGIKNGFTPVIGHSKKGWRSAGLVFGLGDLRGLLQPKQFCDSVLIYTWSQPEVQPSVRLWCWAFLKKWLQHMDCLWFGSSQCEENPKTVAKCQQSSLCISNPLFCSLSQVNQSVTFHVTACFVSSG